MRCKILYIPTAEYISELSYTISGNYYGNGIIRHRKHYCLPSLQDSLFVIPPTNSTFFESISTIKLSTAMFSNVREARNFINVTDIFRRAKLPKKLNLFELVECLDEL